MRVLQKKMLKKYSKKKSKISLWREWGVPDYAYHRYEGLKGIYWYYFSKSIRERDYRDHGGICMTCLKYVEKEVSQCGHLFAARDCGFALLFHPLNNHLQHSHCNNPRFTPGAGVLNAINIGKRYGQETLDMLAELKKENTKEWDKATYRKKIDELKEELSTSN